MSQNKERPILYSTPMVQAIQEDRKGMTRRIVKFPDDFDGKKVFDNSPFGLKYSKSDDTLWRLPCPYGEVGDILWVRETYTELVPEHFITSKYIYKADITPDSEEIRQEYIKAGYPYKWKPSIFMPKSACRIRLEITNIRVERLQDISEEDAIAEGILELCQSGMQLAQNGRQFLDYSKKIELFNDGLNAIESYKSLWESINGKGSWSKNPWIWGIEFKKQ